MTYSLENVKKIYDNKCVFSCKSLKIKPGEKIALIGSSGAGKSTLLSLLGAFKAPSSGSILLYDKPIDSYKKNNSISNHIGVIRQSLDLIDPLPVIHNILVGKFNEWSTFKSLISLVIPQSKTEAMEALKKVGIEDKIYTKTKNLSGGEKQRVALARMILQKPDIILADEPIASLDPSRSKDILELLISLTKENHQTLITSLHQVDLALNYYDRIIGLKNGNIELDKHVSEITKNDLETLYKLEN